MDGEAERVGSVLMTKTGDTSSGFIRDDAQTALEAMIDNCSAQKALNAIINTGANAKSAAIRSACAGLLHRLVENMGAEKALTSGNGVTDKVLTTAVALANDSSAQPRFHGRSILQYLGTDPSFERAITRHLSASAQKTALEIADSDGVKSRGKATNASVTKKAKPRSASFRGHDRLNNRGRSGERAPQRIPEGLQEEFEAVKAKLLSNDWETRMEALDEFSGYVNKHPRSVAATPKLVEAYVARLNDINGKVAVTTLDMFPSTLEQLAPYLNDAKGIHAETCKHLMAQLPSKNEEVRELAKDGLEAMTKQIDNTCLIQPFAMTTKAGNIKQKPDMLPYLADICANTYKSKPKSVSINALPVLYDLIKGKPGDVVLKNAIQAFAQDLCDTMGKKSLLDESARNLTPEQLASLKDMIER